MTGLAIGILIICSLIFVLPHFFHVFRAQIGMVSSLYRAVYHRKPDAPPVSFFSLPWDIMWTKSLTDEGLRIRDEYFRHAGDWWQAWLRGAGASILLIALFIVMYAVGLFPDAKFSPSTRRDRSRDSILFPIANEIEDMRNTR